MNLTGFNIEMRTKKVKKDNVLLFKKFVFNVKI
jgi:hypothetical protein